MCGHCFSLFVVSVFILFFFFFFFFNDTATTEIYTLSLHDALPISVYDEAHHQIAGFQRPGSEPIADSRSEEHTSELQSHVNLVCRLLLEKKKKKNKQNTHYPQKSTHTTTPTHSHTSNPAPNSTHCT